MLVPHPNYFHQWSVFKCARSREKSGVVSAYHESVDTNHFPSMSSACLGWLSLADEELVPEVLHARAEVVHILDSEEVGAVLTSLRVCT